MPDRTAQIASVIQHAVQAVITRGLNDPRIRGLISTTKVEVSPDLAEARVYVSVLPADRETLTLHGLRSAAGYIQSQIAKEVVAKRLPRLVFKADRSLKRQADLEAALGPNHQAVLSEENAQADQSRTGTEESQT